MCFINSTRRNSLLTLFLIGAMLTSGLTLAVPAQTVQRKPTQAGASFPRTYKLSTGGAVTIYEPQIASWEKQSEMVAWSAVSYESAPKAKLALGSMKIESQTAISVDHRLVKFTNFQIKEINLPTVTPDDAKRIAAALEAELPDEAKTLELEKVLAAVDKSQLAVPKSENPNVKADPPIVLYSPSPAILVGLDGDPIWSPIKDVDLKFALNTNWDLFEHTTSKTYYLRNETYWMKSNNINNGWMPAGKLPESFSKLPDDDNWKDVKANLPGKVVSASKIPNVVTVTAPTEMIVTTGPAKYTPVEGTSLLWVNNTESDIFRNGAEGSFYYLVAGRWFSAPSLYGPWTFATPELPEDFQKIPVEHPRSRVLASVPGTQQSVEAILQANVPRTARVNKNQLKAPDVIYQGEPEFQPIKDTMLWRAVNTDKDVIKYGNEFYLCYQAVWFKSPDAKGPWTVAEEIPSEIYKIPASSPMHNVTYVTVTDDDKNDEWVTFAYVAAYTGMMVAWGCVVWGSGWYYPPYVYYRGFYPIYYPYYRTYGYAAYYNPYTGTFGRGAAVYGPYGGAGFGAAYNPYTGTYARGAAAYGPYGSRSFAQAYNPRTGTYAQTRQGNNIYGSWGSSYVQRGDDWVQTGRVSSRVTGNTIAGARTSEGGAIITGTGDAGRTTIARTEGGDIYAGHDGNVYKKTDSGWQKYENGSWSSASNGAPRATTTTNNRQTTTQRPSATSSVSNSTMNQLNRDAAARTNGTTRTNSLNSYRSTTGGRSSAGSYRSGGFSRLGGRRR